MLNAFSGIVNITSSTITGNACGSTSVGYSPSGGGIAFKSTLGTLNLDNTIVSGNSALNSSVDDIAASPPNVVTAKYSALGTTGNYTFVDLGHNLIGTDASPTALTLGPLADNGGPTQTIPIGLGSTAIGAGDPALNGTTDQRGVGRPEQTTPNNAPDIGAYEFVPRRDAVLTATNVTSAGGTAYTFTVTYSESAAVDSATLGSGNVSVSGIFNTGGTANPAVTFVSADATDPNRVVAAYEFTPPAGAWSPDENGVFTVVLQPNQVSDVTGGSVPGGPLGSFAVAIRRTLTVTNTDDDTTPGSLRAAIVAANADAPVADLIEFSNGTAGGATNFYNGVQHTISLLTALPTIADPVTITGPGSNLLTVTRGMGTMRIFDVNAGPLAAVNVSGMTVSGGTVNAAGGAGIQAASAILTLTDVTVANNTNGSVGGGVYVSGPGTLNVVNCRIVNNSALLGGGIYAAARSAVNITNSSISFDTATNPAGFSGGGGVYAPTGATLAITGSTVSNDTALDGGGIYLPGVGTVNVTNSAVSNDSANSGGGVCMSNGGALAVTNSAMSHDVAAGSQQSSGGAIFAFLTTYPTSIAIANSTLVGDSAAGYGGAIDCSSGSVLTISDSTLSANSALSGGAVSCGGTATATIFSCTLAGNSAGAAGGALDIWNGTANVTSSTITGNNAGSPFVYGGNGGGGIAIGGGALAGRLNLANTIVSGNSSITAANDIFANATSTVVSTYDAIGNTAGFTYVPGPGDLPVAAPLNLGPLGSWGGPTTTIKLLAGSAAIDAGDPALNGTTDQRGVDRPQGAGVDIGAYERVAAPDAIVAAANVNDPGGTSYTFTVTYSDSVAVNPATLGSGNVTVTGALIGGGMTTPAVTFVGADSTNPNRVVATYQFTPPGGSWSNVDDGAYTITMQPDQVADANGAVPSGPLATFSVAAPVTVVVRNTNDSGPGSLRDAISQTNLVVGTNPNAITFSSQTAGGAINFSDGTIHTINLLSALPTIEDGVTLFGPGSAFLTIQRSAAAGYTFRVLSIDAPTGPAVTVTGTTISAGVDVSGAAIQDTAGNLTLTDVTVASNSIAPASPGTNPTGDIIYMTGAGTLSLNNSRVVKNSGEGIFNGPGGLINITNSTLANNSGEAISSGASVTVANSVITNNGRGAISITGLANSLTIVGSTIANNSGFGIVSCGFLGGLSIVNSTLSGNTGANQGGAVYFSGPGPVNIANSTIADNTAAGAYGSGGGLLLHDVSGTITVTSSTISGNTAAATGTGPGNGGGGIAIQNSTAALLTLDNTIVSGNLAANGNNDIAAVTGTTVTTAYSAIGNTTGFAFVPGSGDLPVGASLGLQPFAGNGGPTQTIAFGVGSPLLNAGDPATNLSADQRGNPRVIGPREDIGAYEYRPITVAGVRVNDGSAQRSEVRSITVTFSGPVTFAGGAANAAAAFQLEHVQDSTDVGNLAAAVSTNAAGQTAVTLTLTTTGNTAAEVDPVSAENGGMASLADGRFQLTVFSAAVSDAALGWALDGDNTGVPGGAYVSPADTSPGRRDS